MDNTSLNKKIKLYEKLGAVKFQKIVFKIEEIKFKLIKKIFPNFIKHFDKYCDFKKKRALKKAKTEIEKKRVIENTKIAKMAMRKELNTEKNRNYHIDNNKPTEIIKYLKWNKEVHKKGLIKDAVLIPVLIAGVVFNIPGSIPLLVLEIISAGINFECINIQNYNICRYKKIEKVLQRREENKKKKDIEEYGKAAEVIYKTIEKSDSLPTFDEILNNITDAEQLKQMRELFKVAIEERQKEKKLGGK